MAAAAVGGRFVFTGHDGQALCGSERNPLRRWALRHVLRRCDAAVALSQVEADFLRAQAPGTRVEVIPNGIPATFDVGEVERPRSGLLYVGQLLPLKRVDVLLKAVALLRFRRATSLSLVYHNAQLEPALRRLAAGLGIADAVAFLGAKTPAELATLYADAEAVVLPSRAECLPSVVSEALLAGTPVVATRVGGIPEQLGGFGELVAPGDARALAAAIERVLSAPPSAERRRAAREHVRRAYSPAQMVEGHLRLYRSLASGERRRPGTSVEGAVLRVMLWARGKPDVTRHAR
jgi:glycosyltransferase involved in cell wall biosynthesis